MRRSGSVLRAVFIVVVVGLAAANFLRPARSKSAGVRAAGEPIPRERQPNANGLVPVTGPEALSHIRRSKAKGVLVNAWASWCGPCKQEVPLLVKVSKEFSDIEVMLVSVDEDGSQSDAAKLLENFGVTQPTHVVDGPLGPFKAAINPRWKGMIPATFLYDPTPKLRYFWGGPVFENELVPLLRRYLAGEHIDGEANFALTTGRIDR